MAFELPIEILGAFSVLAGAVGFLARSFINDLIETRKFYRESLLTGFAKNTETLETLKDEVEAGRKEIAWLRERIERGNP